jgi:uncharacterized membrane protein
MEPLISSDNVFGVWSALFGLVAIAFWLERRKGLISSFGPISLIVMGLLASNVGLMPRDSIVYDQVSTYFVAVSIPLLLFGANLVAIWRKARRLLLVFLIGAMGTAMGAILAIHVVPLGSETPKFAGMFSATYIGGSVNFAAVSQALEVEGTALMAPALAANSIAATTYLILLAAIPSIAFFARFFANADRPAITASPEQGNSDDGHMTPMTISVALSLTALINAVGFYLANRLNVGYTALLFVTLITVTFATMFPALTRWTSGHYKLGSLIIYVFFVLIGVSSDLRTLFTGGSLFVLFAAVILAVHFSVTFSLARLCGFTLAEAVTASNACALGPASAAAIAAAKGWTDLVTPAILLGVFGYFIANFIGLTIGHYL